MVHMEFFLNDEQNFHSVTELGKFDLHLDSHGENVWVSTNYTGFMNLWSL